MNKKSFLEFDISVSADKKRRSKKSSISGGFEASTRVCQVDDCNKEGKFRAPKSPKDLDNFFWFCLAHVKEYNNRWNYFQNHSEEEFDKELQLSKTWGRPTKPFGSKNEKDRVHSDGNSHLRFGLDDPYGLFKNKSDKNDRSATQNEGGRKRPSRLPSAPGPDSRLHPGHTLFLFFFRGLDRRVRARSGEGGGSWNGAPPHFL